MGQLIDNRRNGKKLTPMPSGARRELSPKFIQFLQLERPQTSSEIAAFAGCITARQIDALLGAALKASISEWFLVDKYWNSVKRSEAHAWISTVDRSVINSFDHVCKHLGVDADIIRDGLRQTRSIDEFKAHLRGQSIEHEYEIEAEK